MTAIVASCVGVAWQRADARREAAAGSTAALGAELAGTKARLDSHLLWADEEDRRIRDSTEKLSEEVHDQRADLASARALAAEAAYQAQAAKEQAQSARQAAEDTRSLVLELLKAIGFAPSQQRPTQGQ